LMLIFPANHQKYDPHPNDQPPPFSLGLNADTGSLDHADDDYQLKVALFLRQCRIIQTSWVKICVINQPSWSGIK
jgi:hypothetical protein